MNHRTRYGTSLRQLGALATLWTLGMLSGCGGNGQPNDAAPGANPGAGATAGGPVGNGPRLMFITNSNSDYWSAVEKGMIDGAKAVGAQVEMQRNEGTAEGQIRLLENALSQPDVKGVAVSVLEAESPGIADKMRDLQKAGKVVITVDSDGASDARSAYIGTNNRKAGEIAGQVAAALRPDGGKTAVFVGSDAAANAAQRREGFFDKAGPKFIKVEVFEDGSDKSRAQANVQTAITKYPDVGVMLGVYSYNGPRIAEELNKSPDLRKKTTLVTFDLDEQAIEMLEKGWIDATVCQNPYQIGYEGVKLLKAMVTKDTATIATMLPKGTTEVDTGVRVIIPKDKPKPMAGDNVWGIDAMKQWLTEKGLKSS